MGAPSLRINGRWLLAGPDGGTESGLDRSIIRLQQGSQRLMRAFVRSSGILLSILLLLLVSAPAQAAVVITFYSRDFGASFPHAFFTLRGSLDANGAPVDISYGFTAVSVSPAILLGSVKGKVENPADSVVAASYSHASATISDQEYGKVLAVVEKWRTKAGRSYNLNSANCVHFVAEVARAIGMDAPDMPGLMKKPRSFLQRIADRNRMWIAERHAGSSAAVAH